MKPDDPAIDALMARHAAYWRREAVKAPLIARGIVARRSRLGIFCEPDWPREGRLTPDMFRPDRIARRAEHIMQHAGILLGDAFAIPQLGSTIPWLEAMAGCPISYSLPHDTVWAETPEQPAWPLPPGSAISQGNDWLHKLVEILETFGSIGAGRLPLDALHLRGATDLLGAYLGPSRLCLTAYDSPEALRAAASSLVSLVEEVVTQQNRALAPFRGGSFSEFDLWAPGTTVTWSQDLSTLFSPAMYGDLFLEFDRQVAALVDRPVLHVHTSESHCYPLWNEIPGLCIEITVDPTGATLAELLPMIADLAREHPLILQVQDEDEVALAVETLPARGLFVQSRRPGGRPSIASEWAEIARVAPTTAVRPRGAGRRVVPD